jgi:hypothetical protein
MTAVATLLVLVAVVAVDGVVNLFGAGVMDKRSSRIRGIVGVAAVIAAVFWPGRTAYVAVELIGLWAIVIGVFELVVAQHVGELLGHFGRINLIVVNTQSLIAFVLLGKQTLPSRRLQEFIHLFAHVTGRPIDGSWKVVDGVCRHLNQTVARLAIPQSFDVFAVERETFQLRRLRRIAEHRERQIVRELAKPA